ncbi:MAG: cytochrome c-550 PedF [Kiloniellales bacterium]|nr:cytochrome c-550 PedF [Kiloniellales bacterium]
MALAIMAPALAFGHGEVTPQPVDTSALPDVSEDWLEENPYRAETAGEDVWATAVQIGASGYNQNCARCHGLEVVSGGLAPDLRYLEANIDGDEWYMERFVNGYTQNGVTKMPAFGELLGQKAAWAIRTYIETRPDDGALDPYGDQLKAIRDDLRAKSDALQSGDDFAEMAEQVDAHRTALAEIAGQVGTGSGAPIADSPASRAALALNGTPTSVTEAAEILTIGLSAAR